MFALEGGAPRIVSVRVSSADNHDRILEQRPAIHPSRARLAPAEDGAVEHVQGDAATCQEEMRAGVSGLPLLLGGEKVLPPLVEDCIMFRSLPPVRLHLVEG